MAMRLKGRHFAMAALERGFRRSFKIGVNRFSYFTLK